MNNPDLKPYECSANSAEVKAIVPLGHVSARHFSRMKKPDVQMTIAFSSDTVHVGDAPIYSHAHLLDAHAAGVNDGFDLWNIGPTSAPAWTMIATPPDVEETVMLFCAESNEPVWPGYFDGNEWFHVEGSRAAPTHWSAMPEGPTP